MHFRSVAIIVSTAALLGSAVASPSVLRVTAPKTSKRQVQEITGELGCTAKGPLAGPWAVELFTCTTDSNYTCQATEMTGCTAGDATNIESLMVLDSTTGQALSGAASIAEAYFRCPENGLVQCAVHFANNGSEASSYGLRITNATEETPFSNATFGAPTDDSAANSTDTDSLSDAPTDSLSSEPTDSMSDSGFGSPTDSDTGFGSPTDSDTGFGSPSDSASDFGSPSDTSGGFGSPTDTTESPAGTDSGFGGSGSDSDTVLAPSGTSGGPSGDSFDSQVIGSDIPVSTSNSFSTSTSGFDSVPTDELSGFS
ncbi:hypothetical protein ACEPAI_1879 [Sanghuangporus weigelae]